MAFELIDYLKDPQLVISIQRYFGIKIHCDKHFEEFKPSKTSQNEKRKYICAKVDCKEENHILIDHNKKINDCNINSNPFNGCVKQTETVSENPYTITNSFWYYIFLFGTELGDEIFYSTFIPFIFWNIDGAVGRRIVLVWATIMIIGQELKDIIRWPRPACPPVVRLQNKWSQEYGMPSTHAMVGLSLPFSLLLFTMDKYIYPYSIGCIIAFLWCVLVSTSRIYLGMHTVLDVLAGLVLAIALMIPLVPLVDITDFYIVRNFWLVTTLIAISIAVIIYYPSNDKWTPTRSDTAMIVSFTAGLHAGTWLGYYTGVLNPSLFPPPYHIIWPTYSMLGRMILRTALGFFSVIATKAICKFLSYAILCAILRINWRELMKCQDYSGNQNKVFVDLVYKYVACFIIGINTVYLVPQIFNIIGVGRPTFYTEL